MKTIQKQCLHCKEQITIKLSEHNRGFAKFCSKRCSAVHNNQNRSKVILSCVICESKFESKSRHAKYCSNICRDHSRTSRSKAHRAEGKYRYHRSAKVRRHFGDLPCFICGWSEATCDVHHIVPRRDGGSNDLDNLVILCPNHHRLADQGKLKINQSLADYKRKNP